MKTIKCGRCGERHDNVKAVQACYNRALPERTPVPREVMNGERPATDRQKAYVGSLLFQLGVDPMDYDDNEFVAKPLGEYGILEISALIDMLKDEVKLVPTAEKRTAFDDGMYMLPSGEIYKVQHAVHGSGRQYAKKLHVVQEATRDDEGDIVVPGTIRFDYAPGALGILKPEYHMTMEQAASFGALYGTCVRCGRTLTKEKSIERSMGPICAGKL